MKKLVALICSVLLFACSENAPTTEIRDSIVVENTLDQLAVRYVKLALLVGKHQDYYIDAYYGPAEWRDNATKLALPELVEQAETLLTDLKSAKFPDSQQLRHDMLTVQTRSVQSFIKPCLMVKN